MKNSIFFLYIYFFVPLILIIFALYKPLKFVIMRNFTLFRSAMLLVAMLFAGSIFAQGTGESKDKAYSVAEAQAAYAGGTSGSVWVKGFIVGYVDGGSLANDSKFDLSGKVSASNVLIADSKDEREPSKCIPVQLKSGSDFRAVVNLLDNPGNLGKSLALKASLEAYFTVAGLKDPVEEFELEGVEVPETPDVDLTYKKAASVESGMKYVMAVPGDASLVVAKNVAKGSNYGYLFVENTKEISGDEVVLHDTECEFLFTETDGGYTIQDSFGRYMYMSGNFNSFNVSAERVDGDVWSVEANADGSFKIMNVAKSKYIQYSEKYSRYGSYNTESGLMPFLYKYTDKGTGIADVVDNADAPVEIYSLSGVKVGSSLDGLKSGIYLVKQGNKVRKVMK